MYRVEAHCGGFEKNGKNIHMVPELLTPSKANPFPTQTK